MVIPTLYILSMPRKMNRREILVLVFVLILMFTNVTAANLLIPSYAALIEYYDLAQRSLVYLPDTLFVLMAAVFGVIWGYISDKFNKKTVVNIGSGISAIGFLLTAFIRTFPGLVVARAITGCGMGMVFPIGFAIISDLVPAKERNAWFAFLAIFISLATGLGNAIAAFTTKGWQYPFEILAVVEILLIIMLSMVHIPRVGAHDEELTRLWKYGEMEYAFRVTRKDIKPLLVKPTNRNLTLTSKGFIS